MKPTFKEYVRACARDKDLLAEFDRLNGSNLARRPEPPIVQAIDMATGKLASDVGRFLAFCWETYQRMPDDHTTKTEAREDGAA
jgi:hypothetical protein